MSLKLLIIAIHRLSDSDRGVEFFYTGGPCYDGDKTHLHPATSFRSEDLGLGNQDGILLQ